MVLKKFVTLIAVALAVASVATDATATTTKKNPRVHAGVHRALRKQGTVNLILTMQDTTEKALATAKEAQFDSRGHQIASLVDSLEQLASTSQQEIKSLLSQEAVGTQQPLFSKSKSLWITNQMYIEGATFELVEKLAQLSSVADIREEEVFPAPRLSASATPSNSTSGLEATSITWGVKKIQAPEVWAKGFTGQNVVVGVFDSGARGTHEALRGNFLGEYGWYDPEKQAAEPYDNTGHGSHVAGSIAGANGIGVAPGAKWMACKSCRTDECPLSDTLACMQFFLCPTDTNGNNKDCSKAPHIVNNSWGTAGGYNGLTAAVDAWRAAGIIPVFANGNVAGSCSTVLSPGDYPNVIAVGGTSENDSLYRASAVGPSLSGLLKPEVAAPGVDINSAWFDGDASYHVTSGTSMASPHVAGAIALLLSAKPGLTYDQVRAALISTTDTKTLVTTNRTCGGTPDNVFPNNIFGYGRINVLNAFNQLQQ